MRLTPGNDLNLGILPGSDSALLFPRTARDKHLYVCGGTGTGKSKFLENLIRQDIRAWHKSGCGLLVLDPHGNLYDNLIQWLAGQEIGRPIVPIDLRQDKWVVSYNLLRRRSNTDPSVLVGNITDAMAHVWGADGTDKTPLFARWIGNILRPLYDKHLTLVEAEHLIDPLGGHMRHLITSDVGDKLTQQDWQSASTFNPREFEAQLGSTVNRLRRFLGNQTMRSMFGQPEASLDFGKALEEGQIVIVSLATEHGYVSQENANLFGTLLLSDLWTAARERGKRDGIKPFYVYLDEFQEFVTPTIAKNLAQARGFGLHFTLANQFLAQVLDKGEPGKAVYKEIMENASSKIVFRLTDEENLLPMAKWLFRGRLNPDEIKHELYSTKVMAYCEEMKEVRGESHGTGSGRGIQRGRASGSGTGGTLGFYGDDTTVNPHSTSESFNDFAAESASDSESRTESTTHSRSYVPTLVPVMGKELSHVQFRSLEEQLFRSMAVLFDQQQRHSVARLVGMSAPVSLRTPTTEKKPSGDRRVRTYIDRCNRKLPFALPAATAKRHLIDRAANLANILIASAPGEPITTKRRLDRAEKPDET